MNIRFLPLSPGYFVLWVILMVILGSKVFLISPAGQADLLGLGLFGVAMLAFSYLGAWLVWSTSREDKKRRGELTYLGIMTVLFLVRTVMLYGEAMAAAR